MTGRWLPQFDLVSLRIDDPGKLTVLGFIDLVEDVASVLPERSDHRVKLFHAVVDPASRLEAQLSQLTQERQNHLSQALGLLKWKAVAGVLYLFDP